MNYIPVNSVVLVATERALLLKMPDEQKWIPRAVVEDGDTIIKGDEDIRVAKWFADREGLS